MPKKRLSMRKIREVLRLKYECNRTCRDIGDSCGIGSSTVSDYLQRAKMAGLDWPLPDELDDTSLVLLTAHMEPFHDRLKGATSRSV